MKKIFGYIFLFLLLIMIVLGIIGIRKFDNFINGKSTNYLTYSHESKPIHFHWTSDSIGSYHEKQTAIIIDARIKGLKHHFYMQFDTGSPNTYIYEKPLNSLRALGLHIKVIIKDEERCVENLDFILDDNYIEASNIKIHPNYGRSFTHQDTGLYIKLGTIGSDFLDNRITTIDFKKQEIELFVDRPEWMSELMNFKAFDFTSKRRIILPVVIDKKKYEFLYDSGCSAFGLITIKRRFDEYADSPAAEIKYGANSWGSSIPIITKPSQKLCRVGNTNLKLKRVSYVNMCAWVQPLVIPFTRIGGWVGNQPFNDTKLILDMVNEEFTILKI